MRFCINTLFPWRLCALARDVFAFLNAEGDLILARLNRDGYHETSRTNIIGPTWAHPAFANHRVFARSDTEIVAVELGRGK